MTTRIPVIAVVCACAYAAVASELDLTRACIVRVRRENPQQKLAADDLAKHLELISGVKPSEGGKTSTNCVVFAFRRPASEPPGHRFMSYAKREGNTIYFWGDDLPTRGGPQYGSGFAVAEFLERFLGVLWVRPGDEGIVFARRRKCNVPDDWRWERRYPFYTSLVRGCDPLWGMRMKYAERRPFRYGHAFRKWQDAYLKDHPEYFGLNPYGRRGVEGARSRTAKLCLSNDACIDQIIANWTGARTNQFLNICPNDGTPGYCHCEKCLALDVRQPGESFYANLTDRYLNFWNRVAARARAIRPDVKVVSYIYSYYRHPPRRERIAYPESMIFGLVPSLLDDYRAELLAWKAAGLKENTFFLRPNFTAYSGKLPRGQERAIYDCYHHYLENGSFGFDYDGHWAPVMAFEYYVLMRQLAHPDYPFGRIEDEYCSQYGACAATAKTYFARLRTRGDRAREMRRAKMAAQQNDVLDDSLLSAFAADRHTEKDLKDDLEFLEAADASRLTDAERRRWDALKAEARGYIEAFATAEQHAKHPPKLKEEGWRVSFDAPSLQGWKLLDLVGECTVEEASFDRYSVRLTTRAEDGIGLWLSNAPVTSGAAYELSFDVKARDCERSVTLRVAADGKTLGVGSVVAVAGNWRQGTLSFAVPEGVHAAAFYLSVGGGEPGRTIYVDNIVLTRR